MGNFEWERCAVGGHEGGDILVSKAGPMRRLRRDITSWVNNLILQKIMVEISDAANGKQLHGVRRV